MSTTNFLSNPIAIVGSSCRFPGQSTTPSKLAELLQQPRDVRREFNPEILNLKRFYSSDPDAPGSTNVKNQGYLLAEDSRVFDASFFSVSPYEAESMDPQLRIMLETVYEALESAGYSLDQMRGSKTSVHVGVMASDYYDIQARDPETIPLYAATGTARSTLSNRISYTFDFHGPSVTIDTACSSSLVALHQAVQGLQAGDATCAIVGGVNLIFDAMLYVMLSNLHMLSPESQSRMWDKTVNGYARGEGSAVVVLKPLEQALRDNDHIEGVIRGTGVNSDGQSPGLTMPTVDAQAALIRETYQRAGLDPVKDRCQFFECHGTGTPAGDPVEAQAIYEAMIRNRDSAGPQPTAPLYVGSIKTLIGHLEGGAGLAGILKALLSIKHRTIFPNLLFNELNPKIKPYYDGLQIPTSPLPWPELPPGVPLRVSVNNFGFGGTNAHAIIESYETKDTEEPVAIQKVDGTHLSPFVISAHSVSSLLGNAHALLKYLVDNPSVSLADLNWTLYSRRTAHRVRTFFSAQTRDVLIRDLEKFTEQHRKATNQDDVGIRHRPVDPNKEPRILGIFTGQGAQWPTMGRSLIDKSSLFRLVLEQCDAVLKSLPDGPEWSLIEELSKDPSSSRVREAIISQPICSAIQIGLIEVLSASGVHFNTVVGHSSGEISAVYACGIIDLAAAMQIAYYRGKYAHLAHGSNGQAGGMMAVGIDYDTAQTFCHQPEYQDSICVAAHNAPKSVTLSGDLEAIHRAKEYFDQERIFARLLKVDTAYHSQHMKLCASKYLESLKNCDIRVKPPKEECTWVSTVYGDTTLLGGSLESLEGPYWVQNMVETVLFCPAIKAAAQQGEPYDLAIEIGPHPALKGPTQQALDFVSAPVLPYVGTLKRDHSDVEAVGETIGSLWCHLGPRVINLDGFRRSFASEDLKPMKMLNDIPHYAWDHDRVYWRESRISRNYRRNNDVRHQLLGRRVPDDTERELRWRNVLRIKELPWTQGHVISGEILLPGTSYISLCCQAGRVIAGEKSIRLIEIEDISIRRPVIVPDTREGLETTFTVCLGDSEDPSCTSGNFSYYYYDTHLGSMVRSCDGKINLYTGEPSNNELPRYGPSPPSLQPVDSDEGYNVFSQNGLVYTGTFRRLENVQRRLDYAISTAEWTVDELGGDYSLHPAVLDVSWQNLFHARADPKVGRLPTAILPVHIKRVTVNPCIQLVEESKLRIKTESVITARNGIALIGDVHIYHPSSEAMAVQMESVSLEPIAPLTEEQDRRIFFDTVYKLDPSLCLMEPTPDPKNGQRIQELGADIERVVLFYVQRVLEGLPPSERLGLLWYHQRLVESFESSIRLIQEGRHPVIEKSWLADKPDILDTIFSKWPGTVDLELVRTVGENMLDFLKRRTSLLEIVMKDGLAGRLYSEGCGFIEVNEGMFDVLQQIAHKFPQANYLEIGAGTGSTTDYVLRTIGNSFYTYTFTDISPAFFGDAAKRFSDFHGKTIFKTLDVEKDVGPQGYQKHAYDVVIASNVLHATASIKKTLENARSLLKPGGYLLLIEITGTEMMRTTFCVGGLQGWWLGVKEGRKLHPGLTTEEWHSTLQDTGFSGVDLAFHDIPNSRQHCLSFMASQAINDTVQQLREPLEYIFDVPDVTSLLVIGGKTLAISKAVTAIKRLIGPVWSNRITIASDIEAVDFSRVGSRMDVLCLQELDNALFSEPMTEKRLKILQTLFVTARNVLWTSAKSRSDSPQSNMMVGMARAICKELPHLNMQFLDLGPIVNPSSVARTVLEAFIRLKILSVHEHDIHPLLWPQEPELVVEGSDTLIPRVRPDQSLNDRYNSQFRAISKLANGSDIAIGLVRQRNRLALTECGLGPQIDSTVQVSVKVQYSLYTPGETGKAAYLHLGQLVDSDLSVVAISQRNTSIINVTRNHAAFINENDCNEVVIEAIAKNLMVKGLLENLDKGDSALIYNPSASLAQLLAIELRRRGLEPLCASSSASVPQDWITIHPQSSIHSLRCLLPKNIAVYLDCSTPSDLRSAHIQYALPPGCRSHKWDNDLLRRGLESEPSIQAALQAAYGNLSVESVNFVGKASLHSEIDRLSIEEIAGTDASILERAHIISWKATRPLSLLIQPPDTSTLFDSAKTYLMVGMASGLGLSICEWAVRHGARQLVITSRNPTIHPLWLSFAQNEGASIHIRPMDATDRTSLKSTISFIKETLPPIGGVCNAAMVLSDKLFVDMDLDSLSKTLKPKVDVSKYLSDILADTPLDFFIMLSSALSITGSHGQANYHAANMFMAGLAAQRRQNGQAASVIHIGYVADVGYFTRADNRSKEYVSRMHFGPISQSDVHHAFAEAILAGKPGSNRSCQVGVGIEPLDAPLTDGHETAWSSDPRFSHFLPTVHVREKNDGPQFGQDDIKGQIEDAETESEVVSILQQALCDKLETMLQLSTGSVHADSLLTELGIDSLVAVEIRAWFLKTIGIDIPVVKILGRNAVAQICVDASKTITAAKVSKKVEDEPETSSVSQILSEISSSKAAESGDVSPPSTESIASNEDSDMAPKPEQNDQTIDPEPTTKISSGFSQDIIHIERMSAAQSRIYVLSKLMNDPTAYSLMIRYDIEDEIDIDRLRNALTTTMQHHEGLRTCFFVRRGDNQPMQGVLPFPVRRFKYVPNATEEDIVEELRATRTKVWDIEHGETLSLTVLSRDSRIHTLVLGYHHIILDASGMRRFIGDLNSAYNMQTLKRNSGTCIEFARKEQESQQSGTLENNLQYWRQEFSSLPEVLPLLPTSKTTIRPETQMVASVHASRVVREETVVVVKRACQSLGITPFQFYLAVVQILLARSLNTDEVCVGVADANRPDTEFMDTVGIFLNLLPVRFSVASGSTFAQIAQNTARKVGDALEKSVPFNILLDELNASRSSSHTPLFQVLVNYRLAMTKEIPFGSSSLTITDAEEGRNPYDITFSFLESHSEGLGITMDCAESLYDSEATESLLDMFTYLLEAVISNINIKVDDCQVYSKEAVYEAIKLGQGKQMDAHWPETVSQMFQNVHRTYPERVAVRDRSSDLTYQELAGRVTSIAATLHATGHGTGSRIAVLCEPSNDFVASLLAILHIGAIYIPLDVSLPSSRHAQIVSSSHPGLIVSHKNTSELVERLLSGSPDNLPVLVLDDIVDSHQQASLTAQPDSPAFLLYTSGTTGKPKGVVLHHRGVVNWLANTIEEYNLHTAPASVLQQSSLSFDMSLIQIFCALCSGGTLVTVPQEARRDPSQIAKLMHQHNVTLTFAVPSEYLLWLRYGRDSLKQSVGWRWLFVGGETFPIQLRHELRRLELPSLSLRNFYGPTEITFTATSKPLSLNDDEDVESGSPIGKPHPNYSICVLDANYRPLPIGCRGEVCIGGTGVSLGYWDMPAETDNKFIPDPTTGPNGESASRNSRWYRTGDQGRLAPDGTLIYLGRLEGDTQVKLRGLRIELAEVEGALLKSGKSLISTAVVTVRDGDLIAHVILVPEKQIDHDTLKRKLLGGLELPQYMHPARIIVVDDLPRANTGKIDRRSVMSLPLSGSNDSARDSSSKLSLREVELKLLWSKVLPDPYQVLTAESDFFIEGGNSFRLTKLQNEIKETLGVFISARELYSASTLRQMAARIDSQRGEHSANDEDVNWDVETAVPEDLVTAAKTTVKHKRIPATENLEVLLTGATGVLGNSILQFLIRDSAIRKIHCIAVPHDEEDRIPVSGKVVSYSGSLISPRLGLSPSECAMLEAGIDVVIHAGAYGHCLNSYTSVRLPNVQSTHFLASFCLPRSIPLLYVSSQRVPALARQKVLPPVPVLEEPDKTGDTGYMASRWVSERFLHNFSKYNNSMVEIHRPCLYYGDRAPKADAMNGVLRYTHLMRCIPRFARVEGYIDFKNVDDIGRDIVSSAVRLAGETATGICYRHHSSGRKVPFPNWAEYMEELHGEKFEVLELADWIARARKTGIDPLVATYLEGVLEKEEVGLFPYLGEACPENVN